MFLPSFFSKSQIEGSEICRKNLSTHQISVMGVTGTVTRSDANNLRVFSVNYLLKKLQVIRFGNHLIENFINKNVSDLLKIFIGIDFTSLNFFLNNKFNEG